MNRIISKTYFSDNVALFEVEAPYISASRKPGHFVILRLDEHGERFPLTIAGADKEKGTIKLIAQKVGVSSAKLLQLNVDDSILDLAGPLGQATEIEHYGTVLACGGGVGIAPLLPIVEYLKSKGNRVISVIAAKNKDSLILETEIKKHSDEVIVMTDDGSYGEKGLITAGAEKVLKRGDVDKVVAIGPAIMMKYLALLTKSYSVSTIVSLNTIMVDGTGMCGACRISVDGKTKFVCVDGPEFDGHKVNFEELILRLGGYKSEEKQAYENYLKSTV